LPATGDEPKSSHNLGTREIRVILYAKEPS
jgi:hypothetical protein